jgi:hypothetical protein
VLCSGSSAVAVYGAAQPALQRCSLQGRHNGLMAWGRAAVALQGCSISDCGQAGIKVGAAGLAIRPCCQRPALYLASVYQPCTAWLAASTRQPPEAGAQPLLALPDGQWCSRLAATWLLSQVMEGAAVRLEGCRVKASGEEGVAVGEQGRATLQRVAISGCAGPGIDVSGSGSISMGRGCSVEACGGSLWVWEQGSVDWIAASVGRPA